ncbi:MAG: hypothetical protein V3U50_03080, partial [Acidimicrobiia bacterium]
MHPLIGIFALLAAIGVGFFLGKRRTRRPNTESMERRLEEYDFYPFVVTSSGHVEFSADAFDQAVSHFRRERNPRAAR